VKRTRLAMTGLLAVAVLPAMGADANGAGGPLRDGNWAGTIAIGATISVASGSTAVIAQGNGNGTFALDLAGGTGTGDYVLGGSSDASLESTDATGNANAVFAVTGEVQGTGGAPILAPTQAHADVSGAVSVNGFDAPFNESFDFGPEDILSSTLVITSSSCTFASGTWAQEFKSAIQASGVSVTSFQGSWAASYQGATPGATDAALTDILDRGEAILSAWFATGTFDAEALENVLVDAEHFAAAAPKTEACAGGKPSDWSSPLAGLISRVLLAMANSTSTTAEDLRFGVAAGLRTGVLPSIDEPLEGELHTKAQELLDLAIAGGHTADIQLIEISADSIGWTDLSEQAADAFGGGK
jgi:hypothetical protein